MTCHYPAAEVADVLHATRELIADPRDWCTGGFRYDACGLPLTELDELRTAARWRDVLCALEAATDNVDLQWAAGRLLVRDQPARIPRSIPNCRCTDELVVASQ